MTQSERFVTELPPELAEFVHSRVGHGSLVSDGDVLRDLVRQAAERDAHRDAIRQKVAAGVASLRANQGVDGEAFMAALDAGLVKRERQERG